MNKIFKNPGARKRKQAVMENKRRRRLPPTRLAWPGASGETSFNPTGKTIRSYIKPDQNGSSGPTEQKRLRNDDVGTRLITSMRPKRNIPAKCKMRNDKMWVDKYQPTRTTELCVASKKVKEVRQWLEANADGGLLILVGMGGIGKSTCVRVLCDEMNLSLLEWNDNYGVDISFNSRGRGDFSTPIRTKYESQISMFEDFLTSVSFQYEQVSTSKARSTSNDINSKVGNGKRNGSVVLIDDLPNLHTEEAEREFRNVMSRYLDKTHTPTVLIFSDVTEGKHKAGDLERIIDAGKLYSPFVQILQINPVTKAKMKSCLKDLLKKEGKSMSVQRSVANYVEELYLQSGGDIRHAIMNLQFRIGAGEYGSNSIVAGGQQCSKKDTKLSTFHALGKLLYAKRVDKQHPPQKGELDYHEPLWNRDRRPPLEFNPEQVLEEGDIGISGAISFVQFHSPDFFSDIMELSNAFDKLSDGAFLMSRHWDLRDYSVSLCSRAVGDSNKHPAPTTFRHLTAPKIFETMRKSKDNSNKIEQVCKRLSYRHNHLLLDINIRSSSQFASQELPYIKNIIPEGKFSMPNPYFVMLFSSLTLILS